MLRHYVLPPRERSRAVMRMWKRKVNQISSARKCILFSGYIHFQVAGVEATWLPQMFDGLSCVVCEFGVECTPMSALSIPKVALPQRLGIQRLQ